MPAGTLYRGREGMWSWVAHRVTGVLIFFFLFVHVLDTALVRVSPEDYDKVVATYKAPVVSLLERFRAAKVPVEAHILSGGGHGFNMGYRSNLQAVRAWPQLVANWLTDMHLLGSGGAAK